MSGMLTDGQWPISIIFQSRSLPGGTGFPGAESRLPTAQAGRVQQRIRGGMEPQILYSDPVLVVLDKPVGMPSQPDPSGVLSVLDWVARSLPGDPVHPVQRLDRPAGGLMAVARGRAAARALFGQFRTRQVDKRYLALVEGFQNLPSGEGRLEHHLVRDGRRNLSLAHDQPVEGSRPGILDYRVLKTGRTRALLEVRLLTGRHHQIRAQFAHLGCPLAGDLKYGASSALRQGGIALFASYLGLRHPLSRSRLEFQARPAGRAWEPFLDGRGP